MKALKCSLRLCTSEPAGQLLQPDLIEARRHVASTLRRIYEINKFSAVCSIGKSKKLHVISSMEKPKTCESDDSPDCISSNSVEWAEWLSTEYESKWRSHQADRLEQVRNYLVETRHIITNIFLFLRSSMPSVVKKNRNVVTTTAWLWAACGASFVLVSRRLLIV